VTTSSAPAARPAFAHSGRRLHQPWRVVVALVELVVAVVAVLVAIGCWHHGVVPITTPFQPGKPPLASSRFLGNWMAGAIGLVTLAGILVADAVRELLLGLGTRRRPRTRVTEIVDDFTPPAE
jgi:hypothetical protein